VTSVDQIRQARAAIADAIRETGVSADVPVGVMIEVPAAALTVDLLAGEADFLSVGTNDLIQYTLAVDRADERVAGFYEPCAPAVLRLLRLIAEQAGRAGCGLSVCGEMAADPQLAAVLVGLGFREFSMSPGAIPLVKQALGEVDTAEAAEVARAACASRSAGEAAALVHDRWARLSELYAPSVRP
jgi:phosphotransferase system enzyme I (PtsI)